MREDGLRDPGNWRGGFTGAGGRVAGGAGWAGWAGWAEGGMGWREGYASPHIAANHDAEKQTAHED